MDLRELLPDTPIEAETRYLRVRGRVVEVVSASAEAIVLLADTFHPSGVFDVLDVTGEVDGTGPALAVHDRVVPLPEVRALLDAASKAGRGGKFEITRNRFLPRYDLAGGTVFELQDANSDEPSALVRTGSRLTLVRAPSRLGHRWLTRVIRDVATRYAIADGSFILHSSAFTYDGGAYLVIGDSGAGKSTTAIALARLLRESGWMGNDRMHLDGAGDGYRVTACPVPLGINKGSLDVMGVDDHASWALHAGLPAAGSDWDQLHGEDKLKMSSREVERYLGVEVVAAAPLAGVIFPRVAPGEPYAFERATPEHAREVLTRNCFSVYDNVYGEDWLELPVDRHVPPPSVSEVLEHLGGLPMLRCSMGNAEDVASLAADLVAVLGG
ncbi:hypothetical protein [Umezawaea tangerina]|uniref:Hpr(Ser) kinase/phosphatase n=1 Tax=Umezawaea tangerina TaxID=84725 RepID=A0A2T0SVR6_9PSEU|nr:hypothetical protein [Umezawaea tangerina]PRY37511.1 hypothetical protein CLV43_110323 [Umezawaea tangerina]